MISTKVEPKDFYFRQADAVSNIYQFKSQINEISFNHLERIEESFQEGMEINNPAYASWTTTMLLPQNLPIEIKSG